MDDDGEEPEVKLNNVTQADVEGMPEFQYSDTMTSLKRGTDSRCGGWYFRNHDEAVRYRGQHWQRGSNNHYQIIESQERPGDRQTLRAKLGNPRGTASGVLHARFRRLKATAAISRGVGRRGVCRGAG